MPRAIERKHEARAEVDVLSRPSRREAHEPDSSAPKRRGLVPSPRKRDRTATARRRRLLHLETQKADQREDQDQDQD